MSSDVIVDPGVFLAAVTILISKIVMDSTRNTSTSWCIPGSTCWVFVKIVVETNILSLTSLFDRKQDFSTEHSRSIATVSQAFQNSSVRRPKPAKYSSGLLTPPIHQSERSIKTRAISESLVSGMGTVWHFDIPKSLVSGMNTVWHLDILESLVSGMCAIWHRYILVSLVSGMGTVWHLYILESLVSGMGTVTTVWHLTYQKAWYLGWILNDSLTYWKAWYLGWVLYDTWHTRKPGIWDGCYMTPLHTGKPGI